MTATGPLHDRDGSGRPVHARRADGTPICGSPKRRKPGQICDSVVRMANGRCKIHGGKTPTGIAAPNYQHGRYSDYLPSKLGERYARAYSDPLLLSLRPEIALLDTRIAGVLETVALGGPDWLAAQAAIVEFESGIAAGDNARVQRAFTTLKGAVLSGTKEEQTFAELRDLFKDRARLVESERKRLVEMQQMLTLDSALLLIDRVLDAIRRNVADQDTRQRIQTDVTRLLGAVRPNAAKED